MQNPFPPAQLEKAKVYFRLMVRYFFGGTLFLVPLVATGYFFFWAFSKLDGIIPLPYPGLGFIIVFAVITAFGFFTTNFAFKATMDWLDVNMNKIPIVKLVYSPVKDLMEAFVGKKRKFDHPVLVLMDATSQLHRIGFITHSDLSELGLSDMVVVYLPQSYAFAGDLFIVPVKRVKPLSIPGSVAMKFIVSGGISGFEEEKEATVS
ncbi:MAG: hypothetical protein CRN43_18965 [Candidatus Nephrothrix sp. EaCA]|nr:MAG: hypothetical protein CRN43_18965 [Candidatus Nephrothrix sp. EaCA]